MSKLPPGFVREPLPIPGREPMSAMDYINSRALQIVKRIEERAKTGTPKDNVKLKADQILLNKIVPDITHHTFSGDAESPIDKLKRIIGGEEIPKAPTDIPKQMDTGTQDSEEGK